MFGTGRVARRVVHRAAGQAHQAIHGLGHDGAAGVADMHRHLPRVTVVADPPLAGDQCGSEPVCFVYPVLVAVVFRIGCAVLVWESGMHSHAGPWERGKWCLEFNISFRYQFTAICKYYFQLILSIESAQLFEV